MSKHMDFVRERLSGATVRAAAESMTAAVVLTDSELIIGAAGSFWRRKTRFERYPLQTLSRLDLVPNPSANLLQLDFAEPSPGSVVLMYPSHVNKDFDRIIAILGAQLEGNKGRVSR